MKKEKFHVCENETLHSCKYNITRRLVFVKNVTLRSCKYNIIFINKKNDIIRRLTSVTMKNFRFVKKKCDSSFL